MERDPRVERYAWWKNRRRTGTRPATHFMLNQTQNGMLTMLGSIYVNMPVHDPTLYYGLPSGATGRLEIERYRAISGFALPDVINGNVRVGRSGSIDGRHAPHAAPSRARLSGAFLDGCAHTVRCLPDAGVAAMREAPAS